MMMGAAGRTGVCIQDAALCVRCYRGRNVRPHMPENSRSKGDTLFSFKTTCLFTPLMSFLLANCLMLEEGKSHPTGCLLGKHKNLRLLPRTHIKMLGVVEHVSQPRGCRDRRIPVAHWSQSSLIGKFQSRKSSEQQHSIFCIIFLLGVSLLGAK